MGMISQMMANLYKPTKQEKPTVPLSKRLPTSASARTTAPTQTVVTQGQLLRGEVLDLRANQIKVLLENGASVTARTEGTLNLSIGEHASFFVSQTTEEQILLKLAKEDTPLENPMIDKALLAANIRKTERSVSIVTELLAHKQPVNEAGIRHYLSLSSKYPELPVKDLILMELHHIPVTKENVTQFLNYHNQNAKLLPQAEQMLQELTNQIEQLPESMQKQELLQELSKIIIKTPPSELISKEIMQENPISTPTPNSLRVPIEYATNSSIPTLNKTITLENNTTQEKFNLEQSNILEKQQIFSKNTTNVEISETKNTLITTETSQAPFTEQTNTLNPTSVLPLRSEHRSVLSREDMIKEFLNSFLLKPEDIAEPEKVKKYYEELHHTLEKLEQLSMKISEQTKESTSETPKQMRSNLSFMEAVNQVFPYIQLPLKFKEHPAHGELYVYEKKRALKPTDSFSALLHLELEELGTTDIFITLTGQHVSTKFSMTKKESGELIRNELPTLSKALAQKGYTLQADVSIREPIEEEQTPTLLEQFLEEHSPSGLNRYTFDIRA